jgi:hypothetical protein
MRLWLLSLLLLSPLAADDISWSKRLRLKTLESLDTLLNWIIDEKARTYAHYPHVEETTPEALSPQLEQFEREHGYFSLVRPLVGSVTYERSDIAIGAALLLAVDKTARTPDLRARLTSEILSKVIAYRALEVGMTLSIPSLGKHNEPLLITYSVDRVFNLWNQMPAFGLVPDSDEVAPILLFRGTDFSFNTIRSFSSLASDFDLRGVGFAAFQHGRPEIRQWLEEVGPAQAMGFSLGGTLATYTILFEHDRVDQSGSVAWNPAGVSREIALLGKELPHSILTTYVMNGDAASKIGHLIGNIQILTPPTPLEPIRAHTKLQTRKKEGK